ncbi:MULTISPECIES: hypothetical protein [unclassified Microbacterium]|uniref:hypothetical protein n=1 Tax=unclassified Microbacterium TaxID=2609290 RepID=UPI000EA9F80B|nr:MULTISPECIES: hypothetical protein [unclassified Microbacterium]MBT2484832.1 hypothetical protein [Microbacterium sp. ISL-108]RKN67702.1 hypothetical protein D7252_08945 [Microbacterium sp. CGR2]
MNESLDDLLAGGGKTAKFETVGTRWSGVVTKAEPRQATNFDTGKPDFWDDGQPKMQAVVSIQTDERIDETDDGVRAIYIKMWGDQKKAFRLAAQAAGGSPKPGDTFTATYIADGEKPQRGFAPKIFKYEIQKASALDAIVNGTAPAVQQPVAQQPVAQQPVAQQVQQPVAQAAPVQQAVNVPQAGLTAQQEAQVKLLIGKSLEDDAIAAVIDGATPQAIQAVRLQLAAASSNGF